jgi:DNA-binding XRE family transcriptional regulator
MDTRTTDIGKRIAEIRQHRGMSTAYLAAAIGVSRFKLFHFEHGQPAGPAPSCRAHAAVPSRPSLPAAGARDVSFNQ